MAPRFFKPGSCLHGSLAEADENQEVIWSTIWLFNIAMENHHAIKFGKPSISMDHLYHGYVNLLEGNWVSGSVWFSTRFPAPWAQDLSSLRALPQRIHPVRWRTWCDCSRNLGHGKFDGGGHRRVVLLWNDKLKWFSINLYKFMALILASSSLWTWFFRLASTWNCRSFLNFS